MARKQKNNTPNTNKNNNPTPITNTQLRALIERIERMEEEKKAVADDIKEIYVEAKGSGFDTKVMRILIRRRKQDAAERAEQDALVHLYSTALGMASPADAETDEE